MKSPEILQHNSQDQIPAIAFTEVDFAYPGNPVLNNVSFRILPGEFIGIIGPNGGGKTTLLKLIMGFLQPTSGSVQIFGSPPAQALSQLSYVPQGLRFDREFPISVMELVLSGRLARLPWYGVYSKEDYQAAQDALKKVGLLELQNNHFGTLSGGQAQRALIARALVSEPQLLLLDEPTASVDSKAEGVIYDILQELQNKMTIMMVTHDLRAAIDLVERVLVVQSGVLSMLPEKVCEHFALGLYHTPMQIGSQKPIQPGKP